MMLNTHIATQIYTNFGFVPTFGQKKIVEKFSEFLLDSDFSRIFIINGYAGTGKTSLVAAFVAALKDLNIKTILLAPTGRAAKVLAGYASQNAQTVHKRIYRQNSTTSYESRFSLAPNKEHDACFIVDEASMLSNFSREGSIFGTGNLIDDLVAYVRSGKRCRLILVGDSAQLPPIGDERSPALDPDYMGRYGDVEYCTLDEVVRQQMDSGILFNATLTRCMLEKGIYEPPRFDMLFADFEAISGAEFMEKIEECYSRYGKDETIVITRSNKRANRFNAGIRRQVLFAEEEIESGDMLMVVKNNYHFTEREEDSKLDFIANGDIVRLRRLRRFEELYGFHFAEAILQLVDYDNYELECKVLLDTVSSESPSLTREESSRLFYAVEEDYQDIRSKAKRYKEIMASPYYNAVQIKFAYAVTCHKAQGGQWSAVFIDRMLFGDEPMTRDLMRWLYTALTRATEKIYLVNFDEKFVGERDEF